MDFPDLMPSIYKRERVFMVRRLVWVSFRQILRIMAQILAMILVMLLATCLAVFQGIWIQSRFVALGWLRQMQALGLIFEPREGPMFWFFRIIALVLMLACLAALSQLLSLLMGHG